jgi:hypothetical protein
MKNGYDSLLSAAAATANSAYGNYLVLFHTSFFFLYLLCLVKEIPLYVSFAFRHLQSLQQLQLL